MLKQMREGAKSTFLKLTLFGLLLLAMAGLALFDVQGMFRRGVSDTTIASYGRNKISTPEFDRLVQTTLRAQKMKQSDAYRAGLPAQILRQELDSRLFSLAAYDAGLEVDKSIVAETLKGMLKPLAEKGISEKDGLQRLLQIYDMSEGQFVAAQQAQIATQLLIGSLIDGIHPAQRLVDDALKFRHERRRGEYLRLTAEDAAAAQPPSDEQLKTYYAAIAGEYALPEYRTLSVLVLDKKTLGEDFKVSDDKLRQYYDENIADYGAPEKRLISQVVAPDEATAAEIYTAAAKSRDLQKAAQAAGKGKSNYIKPAAFAEKEMPVELSKTAFAGEAGKVLPPVKSPLGWHILYIEKVTPAATRPFESVKEEIARELSQDRIAEALYTQANKIDDEIAGGRSVSEVAREHNLHEIVLEKIDARGLTAGGQKPDAQVPLLAKVLESGFSLKEGAASPLIETPEGAFVIVGVKTVFPAQEQPFDKVRAQVAARWQAEHRARALNDKAAALLERLKKGEPLAGLAAELKKPVQTTELLQRGMAEDAPLAQSALRTLFSIERVGQAAAAEDGNAVIIVRLAERKLEEPGNTGRGNAETTLALALKQDLLEQFRLHLVDEYNVRINDKLMGEMYRPKDDTGPGGEE